MQETPNSRDRLVPCGQVIVLSFQALPDSTSVNPNPVAAEESVK